MVTAVDPVKVVLHPYVLQGDHLSGKPGDAGEFNVCQKCQGIDQKSGKCLREEILSGKNCLLLRPMSHLRFCRATLTRDKVAALHAATLMQHATNKLSENGRRFIQYSASLHCTDNPQTRHCATKSHSSRRKTVFNTEIPSHRHSTHKHG